MSGFAGRTFGPIRPPVPRLPAHVNPDGLPETVVGLSPAELIRAALDLAAHRARTGRAYTAATTLPPAVAELARERRRAAGVDPHTGLRRVAS